MAAKQLGFSDAQLAHLTGQREDTVRAVREVLGVRPCVKTVDTCAGEFAARTSYHYFTYESGGTSEFHEAEKPRVVILSAGPNRIGQGIEFDYCCVHAAYALEAKGYETVMVNCNPETVSTDYDTSDRLYFEPLTFEDVMNVIEVEKPVGVIVTLGGQDPDQPRQAPQGGRRAHHGHPARGHRPRRGPRPLCEACSTASRSPIRPRARPRPWTRTQRSTVLPAARPPELRARRPRHGHRLR